MQEFYLCDLCLIFVIFQLYEELCFTVPQCSLLIILFEAIPMAELLNLWVVINKLSTSSIFKIYAVSVYERSEFLNLWINNKIHSHKKKLLLRKQLNKILADKNHWIMERQSNV